jgi:hypothetical protein
MAGFGNGTMNCTNMKFSASGVSPIGDFTGDGQLPIGAGSGAPIRVNTLTAGPGINITNGAGSITISSLTAGFAWQVVTGDTMSSTGNGYFLDATAGNFTVTLPSAPTIGDTIVVSMIVPASNTVNVIYGASQFIQLGNEVSTATTGYIQLSNAGDSVQIVYAENNQFVATYIVGNITYA